MKTRELLRKKLTISLGKIEKIVCDGVEIDYTGHYKNNEIRNWNETGFSYGVTSSMTRIVKYLLKNICTLEKKCES